MGRGGKNDSDASSLSRHAKPVTAASLEAPSVTASGLHRDGGDFQFPADFTLSLFTPSAHALLSAPTRMSSSSTNWRDRASPRDSSDAAPTRRSGGGGSGGGGAPRQSSRGGASAFATSASSPVGAGPAAPVETNEEVLQSSFVKDFAAKVRSMENQTVDGVTYVCVGSGGN